MKTIQPIPKLALDDLLSMAASAIEDLLEHTDPKTSYYSGVWADVPGKLRTAMLQAGNYPVIPDGYVMVPREPTEEMNKAGWAAMNEHDAINPTYRAMIAAAAHDTPALHRVQSVVTVSDRWIPVSERIPEEGGRYWCYVEEQNSLGKSHYQWNCSWNGNVWSDNALIGHVTHWMPLPAAPQEVQGE